LTEGYLARSSLIYAERRFSTQHVHFQGAEKNVSFKNWKSDTIGLFKEIQFKELATVPTPAFWYGMTGLIPIWFPPLASLLFGFSPMLGTLQVTYGATLCAFLGGVKWGYSVPDAKLHAPTWENLGWSIIPQCIGWVSLLLPEQLALLTISAGFALSAYVDLTTANYPPWFKTLRLALTLLAVTGFLFTFLLRLFQ
jgi:hypothetical protein